MTAPRPEPRPAVDMGGGSSPPTSVGSGLWDDSDDTPVEDLILSMRAYNCLRRVGLTTVGAIRRMTKDELLAIRNFGSKSFVEVRERFAELGIAADTSWDAPGGDD